MKSKKILSTMNRLQYHLMFLLLIHIPVLAQVNIDPKRVILSMAQRSSEITVSNTGDVPIEVQSRSIFSIIRSDSLGQSYFDSTGSDQEMSQSCYSWVKVFPKQFTLQPGDLRTIRVLISPPPSLKDGEYRARLIVSSLAVEPPAVQNIDDTSQAIRASVKLHLHMSLPLIFRKGKTETGLEIAEVTAQTFDSTTFVISDLHVKGNSAYRGTLSAVLQRQDGSFADSVSEQFTAEMDMRQRLVFPQIPDGTYHLAVRSVAVFRGSAMESVLPAPEVERLFDLVAQQGRITIRPREVN